MPDAKPTKAAKPPSYTAALNDALSELSSLMSERETMEERIETIDRRISRLRRAAFGVALLCDKSGVRLSREHPELFPDSGGEDTGMTDAVRQVLKSTNYFFSAVEIRDKLRFRDYDISKYKNVLASIHTILKRLKDQDEVTEGSRGGRTTYRWKNLKEIEEDIPF